MAALALLLRPRDFPAPIALFTVEALSAGREDVAEAASIGKGQARCGDHCSLLPTQSCVGYGVREAASATVFRKAKHE